MKTISNRILVTPKETEKTKNELGLTLPDEYKIQGLEKVSVIYSGEDVKNVSPGNTLLIYQGSGTKFTEDGKDYRVINVTDIVIIYE